MEDKLIRKQTERDFGLYCKTRLNRNPASVSNAERSVIMETVEYKFFELNVAFTELRDEFFGIVKPLIKKLL